MASVVLRRYVMPALDFRLFSINSRKFLKIQSRLSSDVGFSLTYKKYGEPKAVLEKTEFKIPQTLRPNEILIEMLAAPINPADLNTIQGTYAIKPELPAIGGFEGVGRVAQVGDNVKGFNINDWILPVGLENTGTWTTHKVYQQNQIIKIPNDIPVFSAATLSVNPCTAFRMLKDFESLQPGDTVIQNGANSGVGQAVIQIAKEMGLVTINVIRQRSDVEELKKQLMQLGAHHVITDEEIRNADMVKFLKSLPHPKLALNCVGGKIAVETMRFLANSGTMVTYGGMSRQPLTIPTSALIFKDLKIRGFWMTGWRKKNHLENRHWQEMITYLLGMIKSKTLLPPIYVEISPDDYKFAVEKAFEPYVNKKHIFVFKKI